MWCRFAASNHIRSPSRFAPHLFRFSVAVFSSWHCRQIAWKLELSQARSSRKLSGITWSTSSAWVTKPASRHGLHSGFWAKNSFRCRPQRLVCEIFTIFTNFAPQKITGRRTDCNHLVFFLMAPPVTRVRQARQAGCRVRQARAGCRERAQGVRERVQGVRERAQGVVSVLRVS